MYTVEFLSPNQSRDRSALPHTLSLCLTYSPHTYKLYILDLF